MTVVFLRAAWCAIVNVAGNCGEAQATTEGGRDKKPHIAARSGGWFCWDFLDFAHIADQAREVRDSHYFCNFSGNRTSLRERP